jgi:phosphoribosyl 1,2-cyclic phosphodiesterase
MELMQRKMPLKATFVFTHVHWDHIQGFPFFLPAFEEGNAFELWGPPLARNIPVGTATLERALRRQQNDLNFPVNLEDMSARLAFADLPECNFLELAGGPTSLRVTWERLNHPGGCYGYRVEEHREGEAPVVLAFCTDTEHYEEPSEAVQKLAKGASVLIHDAQYTPEEYLGTDGYDHMGWGHSTWEMAVREAREAGVGQLYLTHHDPMRDDVHLAALEQAADQAGRASGIQVRAASQFLELDLPTRKMD